MPPPNGGGNYAAHVSTVTGMCGSRANATAFLSSQVWASSFSTYFEYPMTGDFNGDARDDIISINGPLATVALSNGTAFGTASVWQNAGSSALHYAVGDFNGDGKDDFAKFPGGTAIVALSTGSSFSASQNWNGDVQAFELPIARDFNNDRLDDIVKFAKNSTSAALVQLSNGVAFTAPQVWHGFFSPGLEVPAVGDFNGDGFDDIATFTRETTGDVWVALSERTQFGAASIWHGTFCFNSEWPVVADVNGDGLDDIACFTRDNFGDVWVALSDGSSFGPVQFWHDWMGINQERPALADVDGDERADAVVFGQGNQGLVFVARSNN